ncbi:ATP-dependent DNA/RNA helicase dhx36 [Nowakowskiella sp. JEL0078]|nr:ATP-dependent DNA/RNA helicase dhx36 [Nowakowskiella sp. JEL0078]
MLRCKSNNCIIFNIYKNLLPTPFTRYYAASSFSDKKYKKQSGHSKISLSPSFRVSIDKSSPSKHNKSKHFQNTLNFGNVKLSKSSSIGPKSDDQKIVERYLNHINLDTTQKSDKTWLIKVKFPVSETHLEDLEATGDDLPEARANIFKVMRTKIQLENLKDQKPPLNWSKMVDNNVFILSKKPEIVLPETENVEKKLLNQYFESVSIPIPKIITKNIFEKRWISTIFIPKHVGLSKNTIEEIHIKIVSNKRKLAESFSLTQLCIEVMNIAPDKFKQAFYDSCKSMKTRISELKSSPLEIQIEQNSLTRMCDLLDEVESEQCFRIPPEFNNETSSIIRKSPTGPNIYPKNLVNIKPSDIKVPNNIRSVNLPVVQNYSEVIAAIESNRVVILAAETGAGKTTQVPQFILAHFNSHQSQKGYPPANVIVTQPRRIAAISVAERVAQERGETVGRTGCSIGYQVRFDKKLPTADKKYGSIVFCTTGILLRQLQDDFLLNGVTHIILDEVHERDLNTDLLLVIIKQIVSKRHDLKIILMSATADTTLFQKYFAGFGSMGRDQLPPVINIPGKIFPVKDHYLEDIVQILDKPDFSPVLRRSKFYNNYIESELHDSLDREVDQPVELFEALIAHVTKSCGDGAILCFLPGWSEINALQMQLEKDRFRCGFNDENRFKIYTLHSSVPIGSQQSVFEPSPKGVRKIVLATNIAETSITINDVVYVIDSGKTRINTYDAERRISSLSSVWASLSNIRQRSGRAGRCQPGFYFSLMSKKRKETLPYQLPPEMLRVDLQMTCLQVKALGFKEEVLSILKKAPQPPARYNVQRAVSELNKLGAIDDKENLTALGKVFSNMPLDPWISKLVMESAALNCLDPMITIASSMVDKRGVFMMNPDQRLEARQRIVEKFGFNAKSDQIITLNAYNDWKQNGKSPSYYDETFIHRGSMLNLERSKQQIARILIDVNFLPKTSRFDLIGGPELNTQSGNLEVIRALLCGGLYPNIAQVSQKDEFRGPDGWKLRLTSGSINSWKGIVECAKTSKEQDDGEETLSYQPEMPVMPPRLLCFQEKQMVDGGLYMRSTTQVNPLSLFILANLKHVIWNRNEQGKIIAIIDRWLEIQFYDNKTAAVVRDLKIWLQRYLDWMVTHRISSKTEYNQKWDKLGKRLVSELVSLINSGK